MRAVTAMMAETLRDWGKRGVSGRGTEGHAGMFQGTNMILTSCQTFSVLNLCLQWSEKRCLHGTRNSKRGGGGAATRPEGRVSQVQARWEFKPQLHTWPWDGWPHAGQQSIPHMQVLVCICSNVPQFRWQNRWLDGRPVVLDRYTFVQFHGTPPSPCASTRKIKKVTVRPGPGAETRWCKHATRSTKRTHVAKTSQVVIPRLWSR